MEYELRPLQPSDAAAVKAVQREVLCRGGRLPFPVMDLDRLIDFAVDYYLDEEPETGIVAVDGAGRVVGYVVGSFREARASRWRRRAALRLAAHWACRWRDYDPFTRWFYRLRLKDAREVLRRPSPPADGHVHFNQLPEVRGRLTVEFMRRFDALAVAAGIQAYAGEVSVTADRLDGRIFQRLRMEVFDRVLNHTLTALAGEPIYRLVTVTQAGILLPSERPVSGSVR